MMIGNAHPWNSGYKYRYVVHKNARGKRIVTSRRENIRKDIKSAKVEKYGRKL